MCARWILKTSGYDAGNVRFTDQTGNGHHAVNHNISVNSDYSTFNGSSSYAEITDFDELSDDRKHFSCAIWINASSQDSHPLTHYGYYSGSKYFAWRLTVESAGTGYGFISSTPTGSTYKRYRAPNDLLDNSWHLFGFTFNNNVFKIFVDGTYISNVTKLNDDTFYQILNSLSKILIGAYVGYSGPTGFFNGKISKAYLFNDDISEAEFLDLYNEGA